MWVGSAGDGLALNRLALARNGGGLQVYFALQQALSVGKQNQTVKTKTKTEVSHKTAVSDLQAPIYYDCFCD